MLSRRRTISVGYRKANDLELTNDTSDAETMIETRRRVEVWRKRREPRVSQITAFEGRMIVARAAKTSATGSDPACLWNTGQRQSDPRTIESTEEGDPPGRFVIGLVFVLAIFRK